LKRILVLALTALPFASLACTVRANVGALDAVAADGGTEASIPHDARVDPTPDASTNDASTPPLDAGCGVTFPQEASFVDVAASAGVPPSYAGGTIVLGTYELVEMRFFAAGVTGTMQVRETIVVRGSPQQGAIDRLTEARNPTGTFAAYPLHGETSTWEAPNASFFFETPECPAKDFNRTGRYEATSQTLTIFDDQDVVERKYRRIR
jgi:hypothetical protein